MSGVDERLQAGSICSPSYYYKIERKWVALLLRAAIALAVIMLGAGAWSVYYGTYPRLAKFVVGFWLVGPPAWLWLEYAICVDHTALDADGKLAERYKRATDPIKTLWAGVAAGFAAMLLKQ